MRYEFDFQMDENTLGDFYKSHNTGGFLWPMIGVFAIGLAIISGGTTPISYRLLYILFGLLFIFYIPFDLKRKAKKQVKTNPYYAQPIHHILDEEGVVESISPNKEAYIDDNDLKELLIEFLGDKVSKEDIQKILEAASDEELSEDDFDKLVDEFILKNKK